MANSSGVTQIGLGAILLVLTGVIVLTVLPVMNAATTDYADGEDDILGGASTDDPPSSHVQLIELFPLTIIAALVVGGVAFLVLGFRNVRG